MKLFFILSFAVLCGCNYSNSKESSNKQQANILLIFTDQQHVGMMSAMGNPYINTPNMDSLAKRGVMFKQSYCTSPVCGPARSSIITGRMPHETGVEWNGDAVRDEIINVGEIFRQAGYQTVWGGKWHLPESYPQRPNSKQKTIKGFDLLPFQASNPDNWMLGAETDPPLTKAVVTFLNSYQSDKPFFLSVSYHNPHDICFYARKDGWVSDQDSLLDIRYYNFEYKLPEVVGTHPAGITDLPPLPDNHKVEIDEPEFLSDKRLFHKEYGLETHLAYQEFGEMEWQGYLNAYHKLTEMVDVEIGRILEALKANGLDQNTIIVFTSDHGDGAAAHKWAAKLNLYQESATVPLIVSWPQSIPQGRIDERNLVSQIDIVPTLCDYAGIITEVPFTGQSLRPVLDKPETTSRDYLVVELADYKPDIDRKGRMVRSDRYKYMVFSTGENNEQLFDMEKDPGETRNLAAEAAYEAIRQQHRRFLQSWMLKTKDSFILPQSEVP